MILFELYDARDVTIGGHHIVSNVGRQVHIRGTTYRVPNTVIATSGFGRIKGPSTSSGDGDEIADAFRTKYPRQDFALTPSIRPNCYACLESL